MSEEPGSRLCAILSELCFQDSPGRRLTKGKSSHCLLRSIKSWGGHAGKNCEETLDLLTPQEATVSVVDRSRTGAVFADRRSGYARNLFLMAIAIIAAYALLKLAPGF